MRKKALAPTLILILLVSVTVTLQAVKVSEADPMPLLSPPPSLIISIESPIAGGRYSQDYVNLFFTLEIPKYPGFNFGYPHGDITSVACSLDNGRVYINPVSRVGMQCSAVVKELSEGWHNITVTASCEHLSEGYALVIFMVDTVPPNVSVLSPQNETYTTSDIPVNFNTSEAVKWMGYSLDGQRNRVITGNTTLPELSFGSHSLTVYGNDTVGNMGASETVYFTIEQETKEISTEQPEPFPTSFVVAVSVAFLAVIAAGLLVYFKKRKRFCPS